MGAEFVGKEDALTEKIIGVFFQVHNELGHGFVESVYARSMAIALEQVGLRVASEVPVPVSFRGQLVGMFKADLIVEGKVILEFKVADAISKGHEGQLLHYLRASSIEIGMIMNFGEIAKFRRLDFANSRKRNFAASVLIAS